MVDTGKLIDSDKLPDVSLSDSVDPIVAMVLTVVLVPVGTWIGWLYVVHPVAGEGWAFGVPSRGWFSDPTPLAISLTTVVLILAAFLAISLRYEGSNDILTR